MIAVVEPSRAVIPAYNRRIGACILTTGMLGHLFQFVIRLLDNCDSDLGGSWGGLHHDHSAKHDPVQHDTDRGELNNSTPSLYQ